MKKIVLYGIIAAATGIGCRPAVDDKKSPIETVTVDNSRHAQVPRITLRYNPVSIAVFKALRPSLSETCPPGLKLDGGRYACLDAPENHNGSFWVFGKLSDYYNYEFSLIHNPNVVNTHYAVKLCDADRLHNNFCPSDSEVTGYIRKSEAQKMFSSLKDGNYHKMLVLIAYPDSKQDSGIVKMSEADPCDQPPASHEEECKR